LLLVSHLALLKQLPSAAKGLLLMLHNFSDGVPTALRDGTAGRHHAIKKITMK